ncbi:hypothetical protein BSP239C_03164 [Brevibacterium sp. 239c]|uniref:hypothetical protein n=1 Tax=Brevibacterium sp. 239c TaxID=1965356 RepID=UPI000C667467|nr:hypothetical protein [Brevibacterium sp. 239c]SMY00977.1 hypothetical protein BSP239C_03164 [Brevibacterium sp. 239c]
MNDRQMTAAEMRARTTALGLSLNQLSEIGSMDLRGVRRQAGGTTPVTPKTARAIENLEGRAKSVRESFLSAGEIELPSWGESVPGDPDLPSSFYHAVAGSVADRVTIRYAFE